MWRYALSYLLAPFWVLIVRVARLPVVAVVALVVLRAALLAVLAVRILPPNEREANRTQQMHRKRGTAAAYPTNGARLCPTRSALFAERLSPSPPMPWMPPPTLPSSL